MRRRGQVQTIEPIIILITVILLLLVGGAYFWRVWSEAADQRAVSQMERDDLALLERITTTPEIACSKIESAGRLCVDAAKANAFSQLIIGNETVRIQYFALFGATNITLRVIDIDDADANDLTLYDASRNASASTRVVRTYVSIRDPASGSMTLGLLELRRSVG